MSLTPRMVRNSHHYSFTGKDSDIIEALNRANDYVLNHSAQVLLARINAALRSSNVKEVGVHN